jgi:hypothetical protein
LFLKKKKKKNTRALSSIFLRYFYVDMTSCIFLIKTGEREREGGKDLEGKWFGEEKWV